MSHFVLTPQTELEAVNEMLEGVDEAPVNNLSGTVTTDVAKALAIISRMNRRVQLEEWMFNTDYDVILSLNGDSEIVLGANILSVTTPTNDYTVRAGKLYDRTKRTSIFTDAVKNAITVTLLDFEDLPEAARYYITILSVRKMQQDVIGDISADRMNKEDVMDARAALIDDDARRANMNLGNATIDMFNAVRRNRLVL